MIKRVITSFLMICALVSQSFSQERIYIWESGSATGFDIANIDSISFTSPISTGTPYAPQINANVTESFLIGTISSSVDLQTVSLIKNGVVVTGYPTSDFGAGSAVSKIVDGVYQVAIHGLSAGNYSLVVTDMGNRQTTKTFNIIEAGSTIIDWTRGTNSIIANGTYYYKQGNVTGEVVVSNLTDKSVSVSIDGKPVVILSDSEASYLLKDGTASTKSGVTETNFLFAKKNGSPSIVDNNGISNPITGAEPVIFVPKNTGGTTAINWATGTNRITSNGTYHYKQGDLEGEILVTNLTNSSVSVSLDGRATVILSDAGNSYLLNNGTSANKINAEMNVASVLLLKDNNSAAIIDPQSSVNNIISTMGKATIFVPKSF